MPKLSQILLCTSCLVILTACGGGSGGGVTNPIDVDTEQTEPPVTTPPDTNITTDGNGGIIDDHTVELAAASHLGASSDTFSTSGIVSDGLVIGGTMSDTADLALTELFAGQGVLVKLSADGLSQTHGVRVGASVADFAVAGDDRIAVCGENFTGILAADWSAFTWRQQTGADRIAIGSDGTVATVNGKVVTAWDSSGDELFTRTLSDTDVADIAVHGPSNLVIVTGYNQVSANLKTPYLRAYSHAGEQAWQVYGWSQSAVTSASLGADSEGRRLSIGADGRLYLAGSTDGGNTVFAKSPTDLSGNADLFTPDSFQQPVNLSGSARFGFIGRFDAADGTLLGGTWLLARLSSGKHNTIQIRDIAADSDGAVAVVGETRWSIANRDDLSVNATNTIGAGQYLCLFQASFQRTAWVVLGTEDGSGGSLTGVALDSNRVIMAGSDPADKQVCVEALAPNTTAGAWFGLLHRANIGGDG